MSLIVPDCQLDTHWWIWCWQIESSQGCKLRSRGPSHRIRLDSWTQAVILSTEEVRILWNAIVKSAWFACWLSTGSLCGFEKGCCLMCHFGNYMGPVGVENWNYDCCDGYSLQSALTSSYLWLLTSRTLSLFSFLASDFPHSRWNFSSSASSSHTQNPFPYALRFHPLQTGTHTETPPKTFSWTDPLSAFFLTYPSQHLIFLSIIFKERQPLQRKNTLSRVPWCCTFHKDIYQTTTGTEWPHMTISQP